jgi:hypothetical protein
MNAPALSKFQTQSLKKILFLFLFMKLNNQRKTKRVSLRNLHNRSARKLPGINFRSLLVYETKWILRGITVPVETILAARLHLLRESH